MIWNCIPHYAKNQAKFGLHYLIEDIEFYHYEISPRIPLLLHMTRTAKTLIIAVKFNCK